jgi:hypothetical protein
MKNRYPNIIANNIDERILRIPVPKKINNNPMISRKTFRNTS